MDLEAPNTNERTPLLQPKDVAEPSVENETLQRQKRSTDGKQQKSGNDDSSGQNSTNEYGSMSNENHSPSLKKKSSGSASKNKPSTSDKEKLNKSTENVQKTSLVEDIDDQINPTLITKVDSTPESILEDGLKDSNTDESRLLKVFENGKKAEENVETTVKEEIKDLISRIQEIIPKNKPVEKDSPPKESPEKFVADTIISKETAVELPPENNHDDKIKLDLQLDNDKTSTTPSQETNTTNEVSQVKAEVHDVDKTSKIPEVNGIGKKPDDKILNELQDVVKTTSIDLKTEKVEPKSPLLNLVVEKNAEDEKKQNVLDDKPLKKEVDDNDDNIEVIEEIVYMDGASSEEEEIVEEITEITTTQDSPEISNANDPNAVPHNGHTSVTVRKSIRKTSSHSSPEEVVNSVEEYEFDGTPESKKKPSGFQFDIGKKGLNLSVGDKKLGIGKSGVKFGKREEQDPNEGEDPLVKLNKSGLKLNLHKNKTPKTPENEDNNFGELDNGNGATSPGTPKKSKSLSKMFKRSTSVPTEANIQEDEGESPSDAVPKKASRKSSLLKFGKSRSQASDLDLMVDVTTDTNLMSNFIDEERTATQRSNVSLDELVETERKGGASDQQLPVKNLEEKITPPVSTAQESMLPSGFVAKKFGDILSTTIEHVDGELSKLTEPENKPESISSEISQGIDNIFHLGGGGGGGSSAKPKRGFL